MCAWLAASEAVNKVKRYDCDQCRASTTESQRATLKCGFVSRRKLKVGADPRLVVGLPYAPEVCPGYTRSLPTVLETARSWRYWCKGQLQLFDAAPSELQLALIEIFDSARTEANAWAEREIMERRK